MIIQLKHLILSRVLALCFFSLVLAFVFTIVWNLTNNQFLLLFQELKSGADKRYVGDASAIHSSEVQPVAPKFTYYRKKIFVKKKFVKKNLGSSLISTPTLKPGLPNVQVEKLKKKDISEDFSSEPSLLSFPKKRKLVKTYVESTTVSARSVETKSNVSRKSKKVRETDERGERMICLNVI